MRIRIERDPNGVITNTATLSARVLVNQRILCPACDRKVFKSWPEGWEDHAELACAGIGAQTSVGRKAEFKLRFGHLFQ